MATTIGKRFVSQARNTCTFSVIRNILTRKTYCNQDGISIGILSANSFIKGHGILSCSTYPEVTQPVLPNSQNKTVGYDNADDKRLKNLARIHREGASEHFISESSSFADFPLEPSLIQSLEGLGYKVPFEIQAKTLVHTLVGRDVIGRAVTGSGKTLAFAIPIVQKIKQSPKERRNRSPYAIVVAPTRELCSQIHRSIQELDSQVRCVALYGGDSYIRQEREIRWGVDVVCATPGRLNDHLERGTIDLNNLQFLCLDEADELLNPNFRDQIEDLFKNSPSSKQVLMFSATMPPEVKELTNMYMNDPKYVDIANATKMQAPENIEHQCIKSSPKNFISVVASLFSKHNAERCIVFLRTKYITNNMATSLRRIGLKAEALHSDLTQSRREKILSAFRLGDLKLLCATDVAARGLDIPEVDLVIQVEPPANGLEYYIHRSGRTGRAGRKGLAVLLHSGMHDELKAIREISRMVKLQHIPPPDDAIEEIRSKNIDDIVLKLKMVSGKEREGLLPLAEQLLKSENGSASILASALALLCNSSMEDSSSSSTYFPMHNENRPKYGTERNFRRQPQERSSWDRRNDKFYDERPRRSKLLDDDDD